MNLRASLTFVAASVSIVLSTAAGCGNDVADCGAACPSGTMQCSTECLNLETKCSTSDDGADFQALLTCVANSGNDLVPLPVDCQTQYNTVLTNCTGTAATDAH